ncbi:MAG: phospholipid carrier-dependent glycosyltransferase [Corynebacteriales bacterium]|nr:phospholipid carrier-dependent glycosyltransferase [Mycobacteriales bacterium]
MPVFAPPTPQQAARTVVDNQTRARLGAWAPKDAVTSWYWAGLVTLLALVLRMVNIQHPDKIIFDETYYANDAKALLKHGYERNDAGATIAAHPPFGKWCIALGEWLFGYNSFGWRFSAAIFGSLSVLLLIRIARRMFRSTLLGCLAGTLLALEGLHFTSSRIALLDIFLLFWVLAAFGCLVLDRDRRRAQLLAQLEEKGAIDPGRTSWRDWPWWRVAAAVCLGLAFGVKWSALWLSIAFVVLMIVWELQARRSAGSKHVFLDWVGYETGWLALFAVVIVGTYLLTWTGWFLTDDGYMRQYAAENDASVWFLPDALVSLWHYQSYIYEFHSNLHAKHDYQSTPLSWLIMERPVLYYADYSGECGDTQCAATISGMANPLLWWSFLPALAVCGWRWITRRDWRSVSIILIAFAGIGPWLLYPDRTMFFFYALPVVPFFILGVTMALGMALRTEPAENEIAHIVPERRLIGVAALVLYLAIVGASFVYFYPLMTGMDLPYQQWDDHFWFDSWI